MAPATRLEQPVPGVWWWSGYSPEHRVDLGSHAVVTPEGWVILDPIPLEPAAMDRLLAALGPGPGTILLTNANHARDTAAWQARLRCPAYGPQELATELPDLRPLPPGGCPLPGWESWPLDGGAPGETAFARADRSLVVFGDAVVNLPGRGLERLPDKYCTDPARLRRSLQEALRRDFDVALVAHGDPLTSGASTRLRVLL